MNNDTFCQGLLISLLIALTFLNDSFYFVSILQTFSSYTCQHSHSVWKIAKKVSFNIASEASYVYILSGQKLIEKAKYGPKAYGQTVLPDRSLLKGQKLVKNAKTEKP